MDKRLFAVRGAVSSENDVEVMRVDIANLYVNLLEYNSISERDIIAVHFTVTKDLTVINPAGALRSAGFAKKIPLFCCQEPEVDGGLAKIIRVLIYFYGPKNRYNRRYFPRAVYLKDAKKLRPDLTRRKSIWFVAREYAGIAEAGGVKNVVKSLAEGLSERLIDTTVFLPKYGCATLDEDFEKKSKRLFSVSIELDGKEYKVQFIEYVKNCVKIILVDSEIYSSKQNIYTFTQEEADELEKRGILIEKGTGYFDTMEMNIILQRAVLEFALREKTTPDILHCHDAHTALLPAFIINHNQANLLFLNTKFFVTIHNAGDYYRQEFYNFDYAKKMTGLPDEVLEKASTSKTVEPFLLAENSFAKLLTVSPWYAREMKNPKKSPYAKEFAKTLRKKHIRITGITNGINFDDYNPEDKNVSLLPFEFNPSTWRLEGKYDCRDFFKNEIEKNRDGYDGVEMFGALENPWKMDYTQKKLYFAYHGRIVHQKGIEVLIQTIRNTLKENEHIKYIIMGQGNHEYEQALINLTEEFLGYIIFIKGYNKQMARLVTASADFMLLPSLFEPCGLEDFIAQIYGTIPVAHSIGGLKKIRHNTTGILFSSGRSRKQEKMVKKLTHFILKEHKIFQKSKFNFILENPKYSTMIEEAYKRIIQDYSWEEVIRWRYLWVYHFCNPKKH